MKDDHLTLRLSRELARALARWARERGVPKSQLAREAVVSYLSPAGPAAEAPARPPPVSASELAARWTRLPRLTSQEAADLAGDIAAARHALPAAHPPWG